MQRGLDCTEWSSFGFALRVTRSVPSPYGASGVWAGERPAPPPAIDLPADRRRRLDSGGKRQKRLSITYLLFIKSSSGRTVPGHAPRSAKAEEDSG